MDKFEIIKFVDNEFEIDVRTDKENDTVWLTQKEMASLFDVSIDNIGLHIGNILREKELDYSTTEESSVVQIEGNRNVRRKIKIYNLDMIISVGYRVKSQRGILFRKWANKVLKDYLVLGYAINEKRIAATLFLEFLNKNNALVKAGKKVISNDTLVAITVLTAESKPEEMDVIIKLIMNFLIGDK